MGITLTMPSFNNKGRNIHGLNVLLGDTRNTTLINYTIIVLKHEIYKPEWR